MKNVRWHYRLLSVVGVLIVQERVTLGKRGWTGTLIEGVLQLEKKEWALSVAGSQV